MTQQGAPLPPGQKERDTLPRFGLPQFAHRILGPHPTSPLEIRGLGTHPLSLSAKALESLARVTQTSDFHCVTTWSVRNLCWQGIAFKTAFDDHMRPNASAGKPPDYAIVQGHDGYRACFWTADLLAPEVLLADTLEGCTKPAKHGMPYRLIIPSKYGYKSVKALKRITFTDSLVGYRPSGLRIMEHLRARVAQEERAKGIPGALLRLPYRAMIGPTIRRFERAWNDHHSG